jgi:hypothetical protein
MSSDALNLHEASAPKEMGVNKTGVKKKLVSKKSAKLMEENAILQERLVSVAQMAQAGQSELAALQKELERIGAENEKVADLEEALRAMQRSKDEDLREMQKELAGVKEELADVKNQLATEKSKSSRLGAELQREFTESQTMLHKLEYLEQQHLLQHHPLRPTPNETFVGTSDEDLPAEQRDWHDLLRSLAGRKEIIDAIDANNDGVIQRRELRAALKQLGFDDVKASQLDKMMSIADKSGDGDGSVTREELETLLATLSTPQSSPACLSKEWEPVPAVHEAASPPPAVTPSPLGWIEGLFFAPDTTARTLPFSKSTLRVCTPRVA